MESDDAAVVLVRAPDGNTCSGVLVSPRVVLTAAHCLVASVRNGLEGGSVGFGADGQSDTRAIDALFVHREFTGVVPPGDFDLGAVRLAESAPAEVAPLDWMRMPSGTLLGSQVRALGFGIDNPYTESGGGIRRSVELTVIDVGPQHLFMGNRDGNTCRGDSGGPVLGVLEPDGPEVVVGLNSYGPISCSGLSAKARVDVHAALIAEILSSWDGPCALDGICPDDTSECAFVDPDCDACGLDGVCGDDCARVDLDCPLGGMLGDACTRASDCEARFCDLEVGACTVECPLDIRGLPRCEAGFECATTTDGARVCRAEGGCSASASGRPNGPILPVLVLAIMVLFTRLRRARGSAVMLH